MPSVENSFSRSSTTTVLSPGQVPFIPALLVVDLQNDFCPPNGSLAVSGGRDIAPLINSLLKLPGFMSRRIATQDFHPPNHISFASSHPGSNIKPFQSVVSVNNRATGRQKQTFELRLWPDHCVQKTEGAKLIDELQQCNIDHVVQKGMDRESEMFSVFADVFGNFNCAGKGVSLDVLKFLQEKKVSHIFVVGLAGDICVKNTALDAAKRGFTTYVVREGVKCVEPAAGWSKALEEFQASGVHVVEANGPELARVKHGQ